MRELETSQSQSYSAPLKLRKLRLTEKKVAEGLQWPQAIAKAPPGRPKPGSHCLLGGKSQTEEGAVTHHVDGASDLHSYGRCLQQRVTLDLRVDHRPLFGEEAPFCPWARLTAGGREHAGCGDERDTLGEVYPTTDLRVNMAGNKPQGTAK